MADEVADWLHLDPDRIRVVAPGIDTSVSAHTDVPAFAAGGAGSPPSPYILAVGTAEPRKDLPSLVRAFARLAVCHRDLRLVHVGPPGWGTDALDRAVAALADDVRRRVERRGWVDDAERDNLLAGATVFAYPSLYEGFGLPPLEAMACGTPVVATRVGSLPEVLGEACTLVDPGDEEALAEAIHGLLEHDDQRAQAVALGRAQAARYTWSAAGDAMIDLYEDVVCAS